MFNSTRYAIELGSALLLYAALLCFANGLASRLHPEGSLSLAISLMPMVGAVAGAYAIWRGLRRMDEMQQRIQFDAIGISFLGTALITFGWGFAESAGLPQMRAFWVWPIMGTLWFIGSLAGRYRYQ